MSDLISRQAAIDAIRASTSKYTGFMEMEMYTDDEAVEAIESLPSAQQWIPCSERLPEDDDYRPCYGHDDGAVWWINDIGQMGLGWYYTSTKTWAYYDEISSSEKSVGNVVAWMPLPPSFEEE